VEGIRRKKDELERIIEERGCLSRRRLLKFS
jgi:hypothetical protein